MPLLIPDRHPKGLDNRTIQGLAVSARTGLAYCEIANGTSGRQTLWRPAALYCPPTTDRAYHRAQDGEKYAGRWYVVGLINRVPHGTRVEFKMTARRGFNPGAPFSAVIHHHSQSDLRVLMEHILEKWYG